MPILARALLRTGHRERAALLLAQSKCRTEAQQNRLDLAVTLSVQLELDRVNGEWDGAERNFEEVLSMARSMGFRALEASTLLEGAELALERGDPETARRRGNAALDILREL